MSALCDRTIVLREGTIVFDGGTEDGIRRYMLESQATAAASVDLALRTLERYGPKQYACLESLELVNGDGLPTVTFNMGQKAVFRLTIDIRKPSNDFEIGVIIANFHGVKVHQFVSGWEGVHSIPDRGLHLVEVELPAINLFPGDYQVLVWIAINGQSYDDAVHEALRFNVEEGRVNAHRTYFARYSSNTQVHIPTRWKVSKLNHTACSTDSV